MGDKKAVEEDEDPRFEFICNYLIKSIKIKAEKWNKMVLVEEYKVCIYLINVL